MVSAGRARLAATREALVAAAMEGLLEEFGASPDTGSLRGDLYAPAAPVAELHRTLLEHATPTGEWLDGLVDTVHRVISVTPPRLVSRGRARRGVVTTLRTG